MKGFLVGERIDLSDEVAVTSFKGGVREYCAKKTIAQYEALGAA